ncbi:biotin-dependent carboxyltransferase family protein [Pseudonocardia acaciae]|uniref:5-oxoprolinase subunit C family protein n=1 Tax=Pseudonocardia acaciae TaxID=551276 RepID=UPI000A80FE00|nr:biotin-dependent carboxyltransferase family protein [Pseudonocardia acaciae]
MSAPCIEVLATGPAATIQDLGRPGLAELGVGESGAADRPALRLANRLVGNPERHAAVEITFGGLAVRFGRAALVAVAGAPCPLRVRRAGTERAAGMYAPIYVHAGDEVHVGPAGLGMRSYLAVRGGIDVPPVLGSRATDTLAGLGPAPLEVGSLLPIGDRALDYPRVDVAPQPAYPDRPVLRVVPGPREHWFARGALAALYDSGGYEVTAESNRIGMRLSGPRLCRRDSRELPPEATVTGALQVPPAGQPILFLADHPVTGGYPVIAVVHPDDLPMAAQARPGRRVRFIPHRAQIMNRQPFNAEEPERQP